jgi:hypothetical protein
MQTITLSLHCSRAQRQGAKTLESNNSLESSEAYKVGKNPNENQLDLKAGEKNGELDVGSGFFDFYFIFDAHSK